MSSGVRGTTRVFLVVVMSAAAALLAASLLVIMSDDDPIPDDGEGVTHQLWPDADPTTRRRTDRVRAGGGGGDDWDDDVVFIGGDPRDPNGPIFTVSADSIRKAIEVRHWEEIRRMIDVFQRNGEEIPADIVESLIAFFDGEDTRLDAVLALGQVTSDAAGLALAARASNVSWPIEVRMAALDALAKNGSAAALTTVRTLTSDPDTDPALLRHAYMALGGIGGRDAGASLVESLRAHQDDNLRGVIVTALGKSDGAGAVLAQTLREGRASGDEELVGMVVTVAHLHGERADDELRGEIRRLIEDPSATEFIESEDARLGIRGSALSAAAAIGGDLLAPVVAYARDDTDGMRGIALHSLREARGDDAAVQISALLTQERDERFESEVAVALGETRSFKATDALVKLLDAESGNTRRAAARSLTVNRDPNATKPILDRLDEETDYRTLINYIDALGRIGANEALPKLEELRDSDEQRWKNVQNYIRRSIARIKSGNPESTRMD